MKEPNILRIKAMGGSFYEQDIILNSKECQLLLDKTDVNASWDLCCKSILHREGIEIKGNYELISYRIDGIMRPLH